MDRSETFEAKQLSPVKVDANTLRYDTLWHIVQTAAQALGAYISSATTQRIPTVPNAVRQELIPYLTGKSDTTKYLPTLADEAAADSDALSKREEDDFFAALKPVALGINVKNIQDVLKGKFCFVIPPFFPPIWSPVDNAHTHSR